MRERKIEDRILFFRLQETYEWDKWCEEIPYIQFPSNWKVKAVPPFGGAIIRYRITKEQKNENEYVSVYLDCYNALGLMSRPYWEIYPNAEYDCERFYINDIQGLLEGITICLNAMENKRKDMIELQI